MERCECFLRSRATRLVDSARIPERYARCEFSNYQTHGNPTLASARLAAEKLVERYPLEKVGLMFEGSIGIGKTHLAVATIRELIRRKGIACLFCEYRELLKSIQNSYNNEVKTTELGLLKPVFETEVLLLDELGAVKPTEWVWDTVSFILNTRYNNNRMTIVTTNLMNEAAMGAGSRSVMRADTLGDRIGERMRSRLHEMCRVVHMEGEDYRQKLRAAR
jgi:DNA replication protein DnaC